MPDFPAVCTNCGRMFPSGISLGKGVPNIQLTNNLVGPCPYCGGMGRVDGGTDTDGRRYFLHRVSSLLIQPGVSPEDILRLRSILEEAQSKSETTTTQEVAETIKRETPTLSMIGALLESQKTETIIALLSLILALIQIVISNMGQPVPEQVINNIASTPIATLTPTSTPTSTPTMPAIPSNLQFAKVGRNALCPCGSGKKYKKCHGGSVNTSL